MLNPVFTQSSTQATHSRVGGAPKRFDSHLDLEPSTHSLPLPTWVDAMLQASHRPTLIARTRGAEVFEHQGRDLTLFTIRWPNAAALDAAAFRLAARTLYDLARDAIEPGSKSLGCSRYPIRVWNFIPSIHERLGASLDRYRVFNLGRYEAFESWIGADRFADALPTATGVGHHGPDLLVHVLCGPKSGTPLENPRQRPAFEYSAAMGPRPPCFARATIVPFDGREVMLIGGTASVVGEESMHFGSLSGQLAETFTNLAALQMAAAQVINAHDGRTAAFHITHARAYHLVPGDEAAVRDALRDFVGPSCEIETVHAAICRHELLVEVEAVATTLIAPGPRK